MVLAKLFEGLIIDRVIVQGPATDTTVDAGAKVTITLSPVNRQTDILYVLGIVSLPDVTAVDPALRLAGVNVKDDGTVELVVLNTDTANAKTITANSLSAIITYIGR